MKVLLYAGAEFMTGDDLAVALVRLSVVLAEEHTASSVEIPILEPDGSPGSALFLLGPASQIVAKSVTTDHPELIDVDATREMDRIRSSLALSPQGGVQDAAGSADWWSDGI